MKLTVLGGSAAGGNTGAGCSGYLIESDASRFVIDLGPGTLLELRRHADFRALDGILISHMHLDHILDLGALRFALAYNPVRPSRRVPLWLPPAGLSHLRRIGDAFAEASDDTDFFDSCFDVREFEPERGVALGEVEIAFAPTVHYIPCWAMRVRCNGQGDLGYTADTGPSARLDRFLAGVDVLIAEATLARPDARPYDQRGHLTATEAGQLARDAGAGTLVLTHIWEETGFELQRERASSVFAGRIMVARPGASLAW